MICCQVYADFTLRWLPAACSCIQALPIYTPSAVEDRSHVPAGSGSQSGVLSPLWLVLVPPAKCPVLSHCWFSFSLLWLQRRAVLSFHVFIDPDVSS